MKTFEVTQIIQMDEEGLISIKTTKYKDITPLLEEEEENDNEETD